MIYEQQEGLIDAARELDIKLIFLTSFSDGFSSEFYDKYVKYDEGDLVSFLLTDLNDFDGIVILSDSFSVEYKNRLNRLLENVTIPIMNIGSNDCKTYYNLENVEDRSFSSVVEHVITEHGCKDIYHVAGRKISDFTYDRINAFKLTLQRYGLPCDNERISRSGKKLVRWPMLLSNSPSKAVSGSRMVSFLYGMPLIYCISVA